MASELPTGHPCHQLSNPKAQQFWCRHCMTGFPDPMQRWRHSKECKELSSQKKFGGTNPPNTFVKYDSPAPSPQSETSVKKKRSMDLRCYICRKEFITINEMRDHVKRPCNKQDLKIADTMEEYRDIESEDGEQTNFQIEVLLKAAHAEILQRKKDNLKKISSEYCLDADENSDAEQRKNSKAFDGRLDEAMKIYDFTSDTPESSPSQNGNNEIFSPKEEESSVEKISNVFDQQKSEIDVNSDDISKNTLNKTYVSSIHPQTEDGNKIPKITLKLVSEDIPKIEIRGIGAALPKRIRKRKNKDFFESFPIMPIKLKKKELTLKEMKDKLVKKKANKPISKDQKDSCKPEGAIETSNESKTEVPDEKKEQSTCEESKTANNDKPKRANRANKKICRTRNPKVMKCRKDGKKDLVVILTDCLTSKDEQSKKRTRNSKKEEVKESKKEKGSGKQKVVSKTVSSNKSSQKTAQKNQEVNKRKTDKDKGKVKNAKNQPKQEAKPTRRLNSKKPSRQTLQKEKPIKCKACNRSFKTRDLLIKHNLVPCRMRNTRNMTQIILRPKKNLSQPLPLSQRQINAAKRRKQIAGKLSILDTSFKKEMASIPRTERREKPKKQPRSRKKNVSPYFAFCITRHPKLEKFEPVNYESLSEKDQYFYKLGMFNVNQLKCKSEETTDIDVETIVKTTETDQALVCDVTAQNETINDNETEKKTSESQISPPILEKISEDINESKKSKSPSDQDHLGPPELINAEGNHLLNNELSPLEQNDKHCLSVVEIIEPNKEIGMSVEDCKSNEKGHMSEIKLRIKYDKILSVEDTSEDKENDIEEIIDIPKESVKTRDFGFSCNSDDILKDIRNCELLQCSNNDMKVLAPSCNAKTFSCDNDDNKTPECHDLVSKNGTNRKLSYTVTLGVQTEKSYLKPLQRYREKNHGGDLAFDFDKLFSGQSLEKENIPQKQTIEKGPEKQTIDKGNEKQTTVQINPNLVVNANDKKSVIKGLQDKKENEPDLSFTSEKPIMEEDQFLESLLPSTKVCFDDLINIETLDKPSYSLDKAVEGQERSTITEVEIVLPKGSKVAQLCTDIDWLESTDLRPVKHQQIHTHLQNHGNKTIGKGIKKDTGLEYVEKVSGSSDEPNEVYVFPKKPIDSLNTESVSVSPAQSYKKEEDLNKASNNLLELIAKTMGSIPYSAKEQFEKSVISLLSSAKQNMEQESEKDKNGTKIVIMKNEPHLDNFSTDITVIDESPQTSSHINNRISNDKVMHPSNYCNLNSYNQNSNRNIVSPNTRTNKFLPSEPMLTTQVKDNKSLQIADDILDGKVPKLPQSSSLTCNTALDSKDNAFMNDQDSPTIITSFDFEKYAEHLKDETIYSAESLSQTIEKSVDLSCSTFPRSPVQTSAQDLSATKLKSQDDRCLKPLAIDCSQSSTNDESYICDISPPINGPTHISPIDLAKVATAKMTNELILQTQGYGTGKLDFSNNIIPLRSDLYVSPNFNTVNIPASKNSTESFCNKEFDWSQPQEDSSPIQCFDIHLNKTKDTKLSPTGVVYREQSSQNHAIKQPLVTSDWKKDSSQNKSDYRNNYPRGHLNKINIMKHNRKTRKLSERKEPFPTPTSTTVSIQSYSPLSLGRQSGPVHASAFNAQRPSTNLGNQQNVFQVPDEGLHQRFTFKQAEEIEISPSPEADWRRKPALYKEFSKSPTTSKHNSATLPSDLNFRQSPITSRHNSATLPTDMNFHPSPTTSRHNSATLLSDMNFHPSPITSRHLSATMPSELDSHRIQHLLKSNSVDSESPNMIRPTNNQDNFRKQNSFDHDIFVSQIQATPSFHSNKGLFSEKQNIKPVQNYAVNIENQPRIPDFVHQPRNSDSCMKQKPPDYLRRHSMDQVFNSNIPFRRDSSDFPGPSTSISFEKTSPKVKPFIPQSSSHTLPTSSHEPFFVPSSSSFMFDNTKTNFSAHNARNISSANKTGLKTIDKPISKSLSSFNDDYENVSSPEEVQIYPSKKVMQEKPKSANDNLLLKSPDINKVFNMSSHFEPHDRTNINAPRKKIANIHPDLDLHGKMNTSLTSPKFYNVQQREFELQGRPNMLPQQPGSCNFFPNVPPHNIPRQYGLPFPDVPVSYSCSISDKILDDL